MNQLEYLKLIKLAKTAIDEYRNWDEDELVVDEIMKPQTNTTIKTEIKIEQPKIEILKQVEENIYNTPEQIMKKNNEKEIKIENIQTTQSTTTPIIVKKDNSKNAQILLEELKKQVVNCCKCELGKSRLNAVFGEGSAYADIMFIGEGPGFTEDHEGYPFIGRAGALLTKIIEAMKYTRETVYISNIVKCHPMKDPSNPESKKNDRPPTIEEMNFCKPYLDEQIKIIQPKVIITLGSSSSRALLKTDEVISLLRGNFKEYNGIPLMPTYHPAALLRNPKLKIDVWHDMQKVMAFIEKSK